MSFFAKNILFLRKKRQYTQAEMPNHIDIQRATWSNYENGVTEPDISKLIGISDLFGVTIDELIRVDLSKNVHLNENKDEKNNGKNVHLNVHPNVPGKDWWKRLKSWFLLIKPKSSSMIIINKTLYIEFADFIAAGWTVDGIKKANLRNGAFWQMIPNPQDARAVLVEFDSLRPRHKEKLQTAFGNPYEYVAKSPIKQLLTTDHKAQEHYINYRYADNKALPLEHINKIIIQVVIIMLT